MEQTNRLNLLKELCAIDGVSGCEGKVAQWIKSHLPADCTAYTDARGNLICEKKGKQTPKNKLMFAAHMDEVGFIVTYIEESGLIRFDAVGGIDTRVVVGKPVRLESGKEGVVGAKPIHLQSADEREATLKYSELYIDIGRGQTLGIIGGTGCGKSTMVNLIPRFYEVSKGCVKVDGTDVRDFPVRQLRKKIGMVPQKAVLFSGTLRKNMQWHDENASDEEIWRALEVAQAAEFVRKLPDGLDTVILQGGKNLSGGQKQRLTIARALVGSPEILILDDSASALDFATDAALRQSIAALSRESGNNMTVILVSQRANTVRYADKIIVLDDGRAVGIGTHEQLLAGCEQYREIYWSQNEENEKGG